MSVHFADFISFFLNTHENEIIWSQWDQIISFYVIFKNGGGRGRSGEPPEPTIDLLLNQGFIQQGATC